MKPMRLSVGGFAIALVAVPIALLTLTPILEEYFQADLSTGMIAGFFLSCIPLLWITLTITRRKSLKPGSRSLPPPGRFTRTASATRATGRTWTRPVC